LVCFSFNQAKAERISVKRFFKFSKRAEKETPAAESKTPSSLRHDSDPNIPVSVRAVTKTFGDFTALKNVSFELAKGECFGIIGLNGAGKSTLLRIIAGALKPTSGSVVTQGRVVALLELGTGFNPDYTGLENVYMNASILGIPRKVIEEKLPEIEDFAEIGEFIHKPVKTYSSGMAVRLAFAMLTQVDPDVMIIDEALSVGDAYFSHKCMTLIRNFRDNGKTFLFVSHPAAVKTLCDRAILLEHGVITKEGSPIQVLDYYNAIIAKKDEENLQIQQTQHENRIVTRSGNGKARIQAFDMLDEEGKPKRIFETGDKMQVFCSIKANIPLENPTLGFLIKDRLGNEVYGTNSHHLRYNFGHLASGDNLHIVFETVLNIGAGEYSVSLAVHEGDRHLIDNYDWFDGVVIFRVTPKADDFFTGVARLPTTISLADSSLHPSRKYNYGDRISVQGNQSITQYLTRGWSLPETNFIWTDQETAEILLELDASEKDRTLRIDLQPYLEGDMTTQKFSIKLLDTIEFGYELAKREIIEIPIAKSLIKDPTELALRITIPDAKIPTSGNDTRKLGLALHYFEII
jgi:lipopolysaccharide transport system ATP-binding protein